MSLACLASTARSNVHLCSFCIKQHLYLSDAVLEPKLDGSLGVKAWHRTFMNQPERIRNVVRYAGAPYIRACETMT